MKLFTALAALTLAATPAQALPVWAEDIAQSHCEYLAMGANWGQAMEQGVADNMLWQTEILVARRNGVFAKAVLTAMQNTCPALNTNALKKAQAM